MYMLLLLLIVWNILCDYCMLYNVMLLMPFKLLVVKLLVVQVVGCLRCWLSKLLVVEFMLIKVEGLCPGAYAQLKLRE